MNRDIYEYFSLNLTFNEKKIIGTIIIKEDKSNTKYGSKKVIDLTYGEDLISGEISFTNDREKDLIEYYNISFHDRNFKGEMKAPSFIQYVSVSSNITDDELFLLLLFDYFEDFYNQLNDYKSSDTDSMFDDSSTGIPDYGPPEFP